MSGNALQLQAEPGSSPAPQRDHEGVPVSPAKNLPTVTYSMQNERGEAPHFANAGPLATNALEWVQSLNQMSR
jgi:hypothetical protein